MSRRVLDKNFCVIPWTGLQVEPNGDVKNCIISKEVIGNLEKDSIQDGMDLAICLIDRKQKTPRSSAKMLQASGMISISEGNEKEDENSNQAEIE